MKLLMVVTVFAGCAKQPMQIATSRDIRTEMHEMRATRGEDVPPQVARFRDEVRRLADDVDPQHEQTVMALMLLADAVRTLPEGDARANAIYEDARELAHSPKKAVHSDYTRRALEESAAALERARDLRHIDGWYERIEAARVATERIDPRTPYLEQRDVIDRALLDTANAFIAGTTARAEADRIMGERERVLLVHRWGADRRGESPNIEAACGGPASRVLVDRTAADFTAAFFTFGFYTPVHVRVTCPEYHTAKR